MPSRANIAIARSSCSSPPSAADATRPCPRSAYARTRSVPVVAARASSARRLGCRGQVAFSQPRLHKQVQNCHSKKTLHPDLAQPALEYNCRGGRLATCEVELGARPDSPAVAVGARQYLLGLLEPALSYEQVGQPGARVHAAPAGSGLLDDLESASKFALGVVEAAARDQRLRAAAAAEAHYR
jgi:hypothetical protein